MKLYESPPEWVLCGGKRYRLDLRFDRVLRALDAAEDDTLFDEERISVALRLLVRGRLPRGIAKRAELLEAIVGLLTTGTEGGKKPPSFSLEQDAGLIRAAFRQVYGIDLRRADLNWFDWLDLLGGLPDGTRFGDVVELRQRPIPKPTRHNGEERARLMEAKARVALRLTDRQREDSYAQGAMAMARSLLTMAEKEVGR